MRVSAHCAAIIGLALTGAAGGAAADTMPPANYYAYITLGPTTTTFGGITNSMCNPSTDGCATSTLIGSYANGVLAESFSGSSTGLYPPENQGFASGDFYFEVIGPADTEVPLVFTASGSTSITGLNPGSGEVYTTYGIGDITGPTFSSCTLGIYAPPGGCGAYSMVSSFSAVSSFMAPTNTVGYVFEGLSIGSGYEDGTFFAGIDPMISFAPSFDSTGYT
ncbi:MAG: hypothetical protein ACREEB_02940, partial [Caulobacteraceae bacterium]